jgi:hypothetical protein
MGYGMTQDQMRRAGTDPVARGAFAGGRNQARIASEPQVIIAAECNEILAIDDNARALRAFKHTAITREAARVECGQLSAEVCERHEVLVEVRRQA